MGLNNDVISNFIVGICYFIFNFLYEKFLEIKMLNKYVVSFEMAKELKESGWNKSTFSYWLERHDGGFSLDCNRFSIPIFGERLFYYAPMAEEIIHKLPRCVSIVHIGLYLNMYSVSYDIDKTGKNMNIATGESLADLFARIWIYLYKNNLLDWK